MLRSRRLYSSFYALAQFPYPSGSLHMGHVRVYTLTDVIARHRRILGDSVIWPMGWDAFGLPAENAARERGVEARAWTERNIGEMRGQLQRLDLDVDWGREFRTCDPEYYRWTQWIFLLLHKCGLAYQAEGQVNWDPVDQTVLADEQIDQLGRSWRSGAPVQRLAMKQWYLAITKYAGELDAGLDELQAWPRAVKDMQRHWIGLKGDGKMRVKDWLISRQRRWGTPIPIIHCTTCGAQPVPEADLPVLLEQVSEPCACPKCGKLGTRESDTMDTFVDSSWYFLRFLDPRNSKALASPESLLSMPVDVYLGGIEHAIMHLLYARFINRFLADHGFPAGVLPKEPFRQLICQGLVEGRTLQCPDTLRYLRPDEYQPDTLLINESGKQAKVGWEKMSKSRYNGVDPTGLVERWGTDALRLHVLFKAPPEISLPWTEREIVGVIRWLERLHALAATIIKSDGTSSAEDAGLRRAYDEAIRRVNKAFDLRTFKPNTAVAALMKLSNALEAHVKVDSSSSLGREVMEGLCVMLWPMTPTAASELCARLTGGDITRAHWPAFTLL